MELANMENKQLFLENFELWLQQIGLSPDLAQTIKVIISIMVIILIAYLSKKITRKILVSVLGNIAKKTKNVWDDFLIKRKVFSKLSHVAPALVIKSLIGVAMYDYSAAISDTIERFSVIYITIALIVVFMSFLDALHDIYLSTKMAKERPIKGYIQLIKIIIAVLGGLITIAILFDKNPVNLLVGMGASAAILTLVFRDTILGLVASIQVSANNMVKPGDWIEMPSRNADGSVLEITLNTVKVRNWDRTISTIPTYALVSESFTNWKGMEESDGRRIKRSIYIDTRSVKFCTEAQLERFKKIHYLTDYIIERSAEIEAYNNENKINTNIRVNGRHLTNLGIFRKYIEYYLKNNPKINSNATYMVRHLQPTEKGIPIEIYCFSTEKSWVVYEGVQSDIFDHILSVVREFDLQIFQLPSGNDIQQLRNFE